MEQRLDGRRERKEGDDALVDVPIGVAEDALDEQKQVRPRGGHDDGREQREELVAPERLDRVRAAAVALELVRVLALPLEDGPGDDVARVRGAVDAPWDCRAKGGLVECPRQGVRTAGAHPSRAGRGRTQRARAGYRRTSSRRVCGIPEGVSPGARVTRPLRCGRTRG